MIALWLILAVMEPVGRVKHIPTASPTPRPAYCQQLQHGDGEESVPVSPHRRSAPTACASVARITTECGNSCTGWVAAGDRVVTAAHCVVLQMTDVQAHFEDGKVVPLKVLSRGVPGTGTDVAILSGDVASQPAFKMPESCKIPEISPHLAYGYGLNYKQKASVCLGWKPGPDGLAVFAGDVEEGDSGGPVINLEGDVTAMSVLYFVNARRLFGAVPAEVIRRRLEESRK